MHVTHIITKCDYGGAQSVLRELATEQLRRGHTVTVVTGTLGAASEAIEAAGATIVRLPTLGRSLHLWRDTTALKELVTALRRLRPDVVHTHSSKGGLLGRLAARRLGLPVIYTAHGWPFQKGASRSQRVQSFAGEWLAARVDGPVVCVTRADLALARRSHVCNPDRLHLVHNGLGRTGSLPPSQHGEGKETFELVMVARFAPPKRHDVVLEALSFVNSSIKLTFVGDGDQLEVARAQAAPLRERVRFVGQCDDPTAYLDRADVLVLLSDYEGLPMSIIEAMRVGIPVIANRLPGLVDAVEDGVTGLLIDRTPQSLAKAVERLAADRSFAASLGSAGRQRWTRSFTAEHMADGYEIIYEQARLG